MSPSQAEESKDDEKAGSKSQDPKAGKKEESDDKDKKGKGEAGAKGQQKDPRSQVDPELKKRIDKLIEEKSARQAEQARQRAARQEDGKQQSGQQPTRQRRPPTKRPTPTPAGSPSSTGPGGTKARTGEEASPSTLVDIPPTETDVPPEERKYVFSIKDGTYEQLLDAFARMTGLGIIGEAPKDGKVSFVSSEELSFRDALGRVQLLLFKYKPHEPYWLNHEGSHLEVIRVNDFYRTIPLSRMYRDVEKFRAADLRDDELALLIYTPKAGTPADLKPVRDFLPDYVRVAPLGDGASITIFALVKHINKYLDLIPIVAQRQGDPRTLEKIELKYILPSEAVSKLERLMDPDGGQPQRRSPRAARGKDISPLDTMGQPEVTLVPEDAQGVLIVKAMQDKIEEIKRLLPYIDVDTREGVEPVVIPVEHGDPEQLIGTVQQVLAASSGSPQSGVTKRPSPRRKTSGKATSGPLKAADITLLTHPSRAAIIVIADEEDIEWVRELVKKFDVPGAQVGPLRITLAYADPEELANTVKSLLGVAAKGKTGSERLQVMPEPGGKAVWFKGSEKELEEVRELITTLDVVEDAASLRVVTLRRQTASWVADMVQQFDKQSARPTPTAKPGRGKRARTPGASKFTPDDEHNRLFVLCTDEEWAVYERVIEQLESVGEGDPLFIRVPVEHLEPEEAIDRLTLMMLGGGGQTLTMSFTPTDGAILVRNATEARLEEIRTLLELIDQPIEIVERKFEIRHRDPAEIIAAIEALIGGTSDAQPSRRRPRSKEAKGGGVALGAVSMGTARADRTIVPFGNSLIIRTTPEKMEKVAELIAELDAEEVQTELKIYDDFPPGTDVSGLTDALSSVFSGARATAPRRKGGATPAG
ncbi:MAG: secretin N-terminal domain-containing protein, partial [Planctomycetota bacterium]